MTDDTIVKDTARNPEREALGPGRGGIRAAAKRAARKVAKKVGKTAQKKVAKKTTAAAGKTTKKAAKSAPRTDKAAAAKVSALASRTASARKSTPRSKAATAGAGAGRQATTASAPTGDSAAGGGSATASENGASTPAAVLHEPGAARETPPPPGPIHPGAAMGSMQEHTGGFGSLLALWGPLIIVAFLVLVFRGGEERESTVAVGPDTANQAATGAPGTLAPGTLAGEPFDPASGVLPDAPMPGPPGAARGPAEAYDGGFTMRTSMATPVFAGRGTATGVPPIAPGRLYPSPPGPYRDPRYRGLPTGESWSAGGAGEWMWSSEGRGRPGQEDGGETPVQWVRCAPPYYWCPAPSSPTW